MKENQTKIALKNQDTYVYIDVSNIRSACLKTLRLRIDFVKLLRYFQDKYPNLKDVRYYEGIAAGDTKKHRMFGFLKDRGYTICSLERKSYNSIEVDEQKIECPKCSNKWMARFAKERKVMKSNVDVYLASDMVARASIVSRPTRLILVSCDGDYAEAIRNIVNLKEIVSVSVLATPTTKEIGKNTLSVRLKSLLNELPKNRYSLNHIDTIRQKIESNR